MKNGFRTCKRFTPGNSAFTPAQINFLTGGKTQSEIVLYWSYVRVREDGREVTVPLGGGSENYRAPQPNDPAGSEWREEFSY